MFRTRFKEEIVAEFLPPARRSKKQKCCEAAGDHAHVYLLSVFLMFAGVSVAGALAAGGMIETRGRSPTSSLGWQRARLANFRQPSRRFLSPRGCLERFVCRKDELQATARPSTAGGVPLESRPAKMLNRSVQAPTCRKNGPHRLIFETENQGGIRRKDGIWQMNRPTVSRVRCWKKC